MARGPDGTVYLIHLDEPFKHARHYTGWTTDLPARLEEHRQGRGARLMEVIKEAGISWHVTRTWPGTRSLERAIKDQHNAPHLCPDCTPRPRLDASGRAVRAARGDGQAEPSPHRQMAGSWAQAPQQVPGGSPALEQSPAKPPAGVPGPEPGTTGGWRPRQRDPEPQPELEIG